MKQLGIISISFIWAGLIFTILKWKGNVSMTFSQHAAQHRSSQIFYFLLFLISLPIFSLFLYGWFAPHFHTSFLFGFIVAVCMISMIIAAVIPETKGRNVLIHRYAAFFMADCFVPLLILIAASSHFLLVVRFIAAASAAYQLFGIVLLYPTRGYHPKVLPLQASYIAVFHFTILSAVYLK
jgi:hypothetical protein